MTVANKQSINSEIKPEKIQEEIFVCRHCGNRTAQKLIATSTDTIPLDNNDYYGEEILTYYYNYVFVCKTCNGINLKGVYSESIDLFDRKIPFESIDYLFPTTKNFDEDIPPGLNIVIKEANKVKNISSIAYIILIRKTLEELCKDRGINGDKLKNQLKELVEKEQLPNVFTNATEKLRLLGNLGAHETNITISTNEINIIDEFIISLIEYIYIMPAKLKKLDGALSKQKK